MWGDSPTHWAYVGLDSGSQSVVSMLYNVIQTLISYRSPDKMGLVIVRAAYHNTPDIPPVHTPDQSNIWTN